MIAATRAEYERVRPQVPDIGGAGNVFQPVMTVNGWVVALHRAMSARGKQAEDAIRVCREVFDGQRPDPERSVREQRRVP